MVFIPTIKSVEKTKNASIEVRKFHALLKGVMVSALCYKHKSDSSKFYHQDECGINLSRQSLFIS